VTIISFDEIAEQVRQVYRDGGLPRGESTGWPTVDNLYTVRSRSVDAHYRNTWQRQVEFLDALMVNLAKQGAWHFVIFSPENWPLALHHAKIIEKYIGKPFNPGVTPRLTEEELEEAQSWMAGKFHFAKPERPDITRY
jgi:twinkle protein